jgi:hypothetical protein
MTDDGRRPMTDDGRRPMTDDGRRPMTDDGRRPMTDDGRRLKTEGQRYLSIPVIVKSFLTKLITYHDKELPVSENTPLENCHV